MAVDAIRTRQGRWTQGPRGGWRQGAPMEHIQSVVADRAALVDAVDAHERLMATLRDAAGGCGCDVCRALARSTG